MGKKMTADHLQDLREELGYNKNTRFINSSKGKKKKIKKGKRKYKIKDVYKDEKAFRKFCKKNLHPYILYHYDNIIKEESKEAYRESIIKTNNIPGVKEISKKIDVINASEKQRKKTFKKYMSEKNIESLKDYDKYEEKYINKEKKLIRKYAKKGFVYSDNAFIKIDMGDFTDKIIRRHKKKLEENHKIVSKLSKDGRIHKDALPDHLKDIDEKLRQVEKEIKKNNKKLKKSIKQTDLPPGVFF